MRHVKIKQLVLLVTITMLCGCHNLTLTNFQTGEVLKGRASEVGRNVRVTMPNGEVLEGKYSAVDNGSVGFSFGSATAFSGVHSATAFGSGTTITKGSGVAYAMLKSTTPGSPTMMELIVQYGALSGHGFGEARTNDGRTYKVQF